MSLPRPSRPTFLYVMAFGILAGGAVATAAETAKSTKVEVPHLIVYRRARCEKANFGNEDPCNTLVQWLDSWKIKYDLRDISRQPNWGLSLSQRCLTKHVSCSDSPIIDDGKSILMGRSLAKEMERWALIVDASRVDNERAQRHDVVPEILAKDKPEKEIEPEQNTRPARRQKATEEDE